jgi:hypothetical protein
VELGDCVCVTQDGKMDSEGNTLTSVLRITELFVDVHVRAQRTYHAACQPPARGNRLMHWP